MTGPELWSTAEAAEYLGASSAGSGRKTLSRLGVAAVSREPGHGSPKTMSGHVSPWQPANGFIVADSETVVPGCYIELEFD